jgi:hypothetical protein
MGYQREYYLKIKGKRKTEEYKEYQRQYYLKNRDETLLIRAEYCRNK